MRIETDMIYMNRWALCLILMILWCVPLLESKSRAEDKTQGLEVITVLKSWRQAEEKDVLAAIRAAGNSGSSQAVPQLIELLKSAPNASPDIRKSKEGRLSLAALRTLGQLGPEASEAVPFLVSENFFLIKGGYTATTKPLRLGAVDALVKMGDKALPAAIKMLVMPNGRNKFQWKVWGKIILRQMALEGTADVIPALTELLPKAKQKHDIYQLLALMGPEATPVLQKEANTLASKKHFSKADANDIRRISNLIGHEISSAIDAVIPERYTEKTWADQRYWIHYRSGWYPLAHARPDQKHIPAILDLIRNEKLNGSRYYQGVRYAGLLLSGMEQAAVEPLVKLFQEDHSKTRWAAAFILGMLGSDAEQGVPALYEVMNRESENITVRVEAAKAIAAITNKDVKTLYAKIPNLHNRLVTETLQRSKMNQQHDIWQELLDSDSAANPIQVQARQLALYNRTPEAQKPLYQLACKQEMDAANQWLREYAQKHLDGRTRAKSFGDGIMSEDLNLFQYLFGKNSRHYPGRLESDVEDILKAYMFRSVDVSLRDSKIKPRYVPKSAEDLNKMLALDKRYAIAEFTNGPLRSDAQHYLILQSLVNDPKYQDRAFKTGETVKERYELFTRFFQRGLKEWALHGLWVELGSSNYEHKTYRGLLLLLDFANDPVVAARSRMLMDLALLEISQISLSGLRGGSKTRAKDGGLDGRFNQYLAMLYGEHHSNLLELPGFKGYRPSEAAALLRKLGPTQKIYEIINRHPGETIEAQDKITQGSGFHRTLSQSINYAYCTPEYVMGCSMFDVRKWPEVEKRRMNRNGEVTTYKRKEFAYAPLGRWSGVIFRDASAVFLEAYTGEKWNVQDGDVMISQRYPKAHYKGNACVDFAGTLALKEVDGWVFADNTDAYVAVRVARGSYHWREPARLRLNLDDQYAPIIIQTGRKAVYGSFEKFQKAILSAPLKINEDVLDYTGPNNARIEFFMCKNTDDEARAYPKRLPLIDGKELDLNLKHNYKSPYINGSVGSDVVKVTYDDRTWEYDFEKNEIRER